MKTPTIIEAMQSPALLGRSFKRSRLRGDSWRRWKAFLRALFALPMSDADLATFRKHTERKSAPGESFREAFVIVGRRGGKSIIAALVATYLAAFVDHSAVLAPGETGVVMLLAADRRQAGVLLSYVAAFFEVPMLARMVKSRLKESIELTNRIRIEVHASDFRSVRGFTLIAAICDEIAFWQSGDGANPDFEVLNALRPGLATTNGLLLCISSPYAKRGALWENYREHFGKNSNVLVWRGTSREMNPSLNPLLVQAALLRDRSAASAEYLAEFRSDIETFLPVEVVEAAIVPGRFELPPSSDRSYSAFTDPSGGARDSFTLAVSHLEGEVPVLDCLREAQPPFSPKEVVREFADVLKRYGICEVSGDRYAGEWPREQFEKRGITYRVADKTRSEIYLSLLPLMTSGRVKLLDNERLKHQLVALERRTARGGRDSVDHPPSGHDDLSNVVAGAVVLSLGESRTYGVLDWIANGGPVQLLRQHGTTPEPTPAEQVAAFAHRLRQQRAEEPAEPAEPPQSCPQCGATCMGRAAGQWVCNQCGHAWHSPGISPEVPRITRGDILTGRFPGIRRLR